MPISTGDRGLGLQIDVETGIVLDGGLPLFLQSEVSLGVDLEVLRLGVRSECKWTAAGQIFPDSPVTPRHSALAQTLWDQHTRVHDQDDEGGMFVVRVFRLTRSRRPTNGPFIDP